ncbi:hypothetical protein AURDEDRAFT_168809 [Auricularia subglabra TFB-10046 SS5]|nr:hypothetical protein AURDEDRAFT_168809 [Auricularia subglabra TFB-10046 SS5]
MFVPAHHVPAHNVQPDPTNKWVFPLVMVVVGIILSLVLGLTVGCLGRDDAAILRAMCCWRARRRRRRAPTTSNAHAATLPPINVAGAQPLVGSTGFELQALHHREVRARSPPISDAGSITPTERDARPCGTPSGGSSHSRNASSVTIRPRAPVIGGTGVTPPSKPLIVLPTPSAPPPYGNIHGIDTGSDAGLRDNAADPFATDSSCASSVSGDATSMSGDVLFKTAHAI